MNKKEKVIVRNYKKEDLEQLEFIVHSTIKKSYTGVYPQEAVEYFLKLHSRKNMLEDIPKGDTFMLELGAKIIASGSLVEDKIKRVFVLPEYQGKGYGRKIMEKLEKVAADNGVRKIKLHASLPSKDFYLAMDYKLLRFTYLMVENDKKLEYYDMEKDLKK